MIGISKTNNSDSNSGFSSGPFLRYYFLKPDKRINLLTEVNYFYGKNDINTQIYVTKTYGTTAQQLKSTNFALTVYQPVASIYTINMVIYSILITSALPF